jgi:hypothetical protein
MMREQIQVRRNFINTWFITMLILSITQLSFIIIDKENTFWIMAINAIVFIHLLPLYLCKSQNIDDLRFM